MCVCVYFFFLFLLIFRCFFFLEKKSNIIYILTYPSRRKKLKQIWGETDFSPAAGCYWPSLVPHRFPTPALGQAGKRNSYLSLSCSLFHSLSFFLSRSPIFFSSSLLTPSFSFCLHHLSVFLSIIISLHLYLFFFPLFSYVHLLLESPSFRLKVFFLSFSFSLINKTLRRTVHQPLTFILPGLITTSFMNNSSFNIQWKFFI